MLRFYKTYCFANISFLVQSNIKFSLPDHYDNFETKVKSVDLTFNIFEYDFQDDNINFKVFNKKIINDLTVEYSNNERIFTVKYEDIKHDKVVWYIDNYSKNKYDIYITMYNKLNVNNIDPILMIGLDKILLQKNSILLHSSLINYHDKGIIFSAPSGTGKSTQADMWKKHYDAKILNGDRSIINCTTFKAYGSPYAGSSQIYLNEFVQVSLIIILRQSKINTIRKLDNKEAFLSVISEVFLSKDRALMDQQLKLVESVVKNIPIYLLNCRPDKESVDLVYELLKE